MSLRKRIKEGLEGKYQGLSNGFNDINKYIFGVQKKCYTLIGGASGNYKTTLLDYIISNAISDAKAKNIPIDVFYYSFEIDKLSKECNWVSRLAFEKYNVVIPPEKIKGLGENRLTEQETKIVESLIPEVEELFSHINFIFDPENPTGCYYTIYRHCVKHGQLEYEDYINSEGETKKRIIGYKPNDNRYVIWAMDHLALAKLERSFTLKDNIDKMSNYAISLRNIFGISVFFLQQFNDSISSVERIKFKGVDLSPQQSDYKDSRNTYNDADVVLGLMNPYKLDMDSCLGYRLDTFKDKFIMLKIIKNRLSRDNIAKGLYVYPESGRFEELLKSDEFNKQNLYENYR